MVKAWNEFFFAELPARPLRVFRSIFGAYLVLYYINLYELLHLHYSSSGVVTSADYAAKWDVFQWTLLAWFGGSDVAFHLLYAASLLCAVCLAAGVLVRWAALGAWILGVSWQNAILVGNNSGDAVVGVMTFLLGVAGVAGHLDPRSQRCPAWTLRLIQIQVALLYFFSGFHKLASGEWYRGEALYWVFHQTHWSRLDLTGLDHPLIIGALSYGTLLLELLIVPVLVWPKATRNLALLAGLGFHLGILATMKVFVFCSIMPITYLCFLTDDSPVVGWLAALPARLRKFLSGAYLSVRGLS